MCLGRDYMTLGEKLKKLREEKGYTQNNLAEILNFTPQNISKWERDASEPKIDALKQLAKLYGVSIDYLTNTDFDDEEINTNNNSNTNQLENNVEVKKKVLIRYEIAENEKINYVKISFITLSVCILLFTTLLCMLIEYLAFVPSIVIVTIFTLLVGNYIFKLQSNLRIKKLYEDMQNRFYVIPNLVNKFGIIGCIIFKIPAFILSGIIYIINIVILIIISLFVWGDKNGK